MWWRTRHGRGPPARHHLLEQLPGPAEHPCRVPLAAAHTPGTAPFSRPGLNTHERSGEEPFKRSSKAQNPRSNTAPASLQRSRTQRIYIPKANGKQRPLGIPVLRDRALQACVVNALEPEWEARFEQRSYGFRPGRGCHDAIEAIYWTLNGRNAKRQWILDADLTAAFDRIDHDHLLDSVGTFPARELIRGWLKAGVVERGRFAPSEEGTPQGGVVSPLLLNIALHGMEAAAGVRYYKLGTDGAQTVAGTPALVR